VIHTVGLIITGNRGQEHMCGKTAFCVLSSNVSNVWHVYITTDSRLDH